MTRRKARPWNERPLTRGKDPRGDRGPEPIDVVAPPHSEVEYQLAKGRLLRELYGGSVVPCRHCGWPMLRGYNCRTCRGEQ